MNGGRAVNQKVSEAVHEYFSKFPERRIPKGQILVFAGEEPEHVFYLAKGKVRKYDVSYRGDEIIMNLFKPGSYFPMSWALNRSAPNHHFYKAEEDSVVHLVPPDKVLEFLHAHPDVALDLLSRIYRGMDGLFGRMARLMSGTAKSRLVFELVIECRRFGTPEPDGSYALATTESDLAARSGLSRETVSREIRKLKAAHLVAVTHGGITVKDLPALEKLQGS